MAEQVVDRALKRVQAADQKFDSMSDADLGAAFRSYTEGLLDTQFEGFSPEEQKAISLMFEDLVRAIEAGI